MFSGLPGRTVDAMKIKECPFCFSKDTAVIQNRAFKNPQNWWVECRKCEATGPEYRLQKVAVEAWNAVTENRDLLIADCDRLRRELDDEMGIMR